VSAATTTVNIGDFWFCNSSFSNSVCPTRINPGDTVTYGNGSGMLRTRLPREATVRLQRAARRRAGTRRS
jgi:hypothetical protein